jgi:UDP-N-acetylmuramoylalanine--D-glutamate ligase
VLNAEDKTCVALVERAKAQVYWFSNRKEVERGAFVWNGEIQFRDGKTQPIMPVSELSLKGAHNVENALAAVCAGMLMKCDPAKIRQAVRNFKAVEHRLEYVATVRGVEYYNDSKATNVDATMKALESFPANIHLILGGKDKGSDYRVLNSLLRERVKAAYTIGSAAEKIESQIRGATKIIHAETLENAIQKAASSARAGDVILLAPACSSFDQFENYEHRGQVFKQSVASLAQAELATAG